MNCPWISHERLYLKQQTACIRLSRSNPNARSYCRICSISDFVTECDSASCIIVVGRVQVPFQPQNSVANALSHVGKPYDFYFLPDDEEMYCSELVQKCYVSASGDLLFTTIPMTFRTASGELPDYWVKHYQKKGIPIPEGAPGSNPGELSRRPQVRILGELKP